MKKTRSTRNQKHRTWSAFKQFSLKLKNTSYNMIAHQFVFPLDCLSFVVRPIKISKKNYNEFFISHYIILHHITNSFLSLISLNVNHLFNSYFFSLWFNSTFWLRFHFICKISIGATYNSWNLWTNVRNDCTFGNIFSTQNSHLVDEVHMFLHFWMKQNDHKFKLQLKFWRTHSQ